MASNNRRTMGARILKANATVDDTNLWSIGLAIALTLIIIHSLSYVTVEYGMYNNRNVYSQYTKQQMCLSELQKSKFDVYDTERYSEFMGECLLRLMCQYSLRMVRFHFYAYTLHSY